MPIDFTQLYRPGGAVPRSQGESLPTASARTAIDLPLKVGEVAQAQVVRQQSLSVEQRQWLAGQTPLPAGLAPSTKPMAPPPLGQDLKLALAAGESVRLVTLALKGTSLPVLSKEPLQTGQQVSVLLNAKRQLSLQPAPPAPAATVSQATTGGSAQLGRAPIEPKALAQALREILPQQSAPRLETNIPLLQQLLSRLPVSGRLEAVQALLARIDRQPVTAPEVNTTTLKSAMGHSGTFFEQKLASASRQGPETVQNLINSDRKALLLKLVQTLAPAVPGPAAQSPPTQPSNSAPAADLALIARLLAGSENAVTKPPVPTGAPAPPASAPKSQPSLSGTQPSPPESSAAVDKRWSLPALSQLLLAQPPRALPANDARVLQTQLMLLTHQLTLSSLARVRHNQLQPEITRARAGETQSPSNSVSLDLPIRVDQQLCHTRLTIEEQAQDRQTQKGSSKRRQWQVTLAMNTPKVGDIYAQLRYCQDDLAVVIWGEDRHVLAEAREKFKQIAAALKASGVTLTDIQYREGAPQQAGNQLGYHLVDVKT